MGPRDKRSLNKQGIVVQQTERIPQSSSAQVLLGRYRILETNTQGGFGTVNVCWDARLQRRVAIKRMPLRLGEHSPSEASTMAEALSEARTSSMLSHPNIVTMFDFERDESYSYLVMEYVDGLNLADFLARVEGGVLTFDECAHLVDSLASALAFAHENGVLHLDIKPANIMVDRTGTVKLADFGMASLASAAGYGGARGGTVGYMPPEQIDGDYVDERTDIFSLAVVVWQALTGRCPFAAATAEKSLALIERGPKPPLSRVEPELAGIVEETLLQALEPSPMTRTASVERFARDLVPALGNPQEGATSLRDLLNQAEPDEEPDAVEDWDRLHVPLSARVPWFLPACARTLAGVASAWFAYRLAPFLVADSPRIIMLTAAVTAAASVAWPPITGLLALALVIAALLATPSTLGIALALVVGSIALVWWVLSGRRSQVSGPALVAPFCLSSPLAGVGLSAFGLGPAGAFFTGMGSYLLFVFLELAINVGFAAEDLTHLLRDFLLVPHTWVVALGCGIAACTGAAIARKRSVSRTMMGQLVASLLLIGLYMLSTRMENGDIAAPLGVTSLVVALIFSVTLCIVCAVAGDNGNHQEGVDQI